MSRCVAYWSLVLVRLPLWARWVACLALLSAVTACGNRPTHHTSTRYNPSRYYPPPGPSGDPWGPYIHEASGRFGVPELWIRRVMRQESGGQEDVISWAGAMGLMQVMPDTYDDLRGRHNLGDDPFDPHNNVLAGTAYLREMYDRFGAPGFLAAYNAGPNRVDRYLNNGTPLPDETVNYVASIAPSLGPGTPLSGPLAVYAASAGSAPQLASRQSSSLCDPDAAYNPDGPCAPVRQATIEPAVYAAATPTPTSYGTTACDADAAYDPTQPCTPVQTSQPPVSVAAVPSYAPPGDCNSEAAYDPTRACRPAPSTPAASVPVVVTLLPEPPRSGGSADHLPGIRRPLQERMVQRVAFNAAAALGAWGIQVGAFANLATAQAAADNARAILPVLLRTTKVELPATTPFGGKVAFRARLVGLSSADATNACTQLGARGLRCMTVPPAKDEF